MRIELESRGREPIRTPLLALPVPDGREPDLWPSLARAARAARSTGDAKTEFRKCRLFYGPGRGGHQRLLWMGAGKVEGFTTERLRRLAALAQHHAEDVEVASFVLALPGELVGRLPGFAAGRAVAEGLVLGAYRYQPPSRKKRKPRHAQSASVVVLGKAPDGFAEGFRFGAAGGAAAGFARELGDLSAGVMTPSRMAQEAKQFAAAGIKVRVFGEQDMRRFKMGALLGVARGSAEPAKLIVLDYAPAGARGSVCIVGKGLTFDSGGISLKPGAKMDEMRYDMCGGAAVLGVFHALRTLRPRLRVIGVVPSSENMPDGEAQKPGDIVTACDGTTIEVLNTDAEGRLILCDALAWARKRWRPDVMIDLATLTGAVITALGHEATGVFGNDQPLIDELRAAGESADERLWQLPLWDVHREAMKSKYADLHNISSPSVGASSITGAAFLSYFTEGVPWAHLDIAGSAWGAKDKDHYRGGGASGVGVRLLLEFLRLRSARPRGAKKTGARRPARRRAPRAARAR